MTVAAGRAMSTLAQLHLEIAARVQVIRDGRPDWQCAKGCDGCCRQLADEPRLTAAEWDLLCQGLAGLPAGRLQHIRAAVAMFDGWRHGPLVCPLLDRASGACSVYAWRPVACRSYGFYVQRERGLYCRDIEERVAAGALADVVWGNHDAIDRQLAGLGEMRTLGEWFAGWPDRT